MCLHNYNWSTYSVPKKPNMVSCFQDKIVFKAFVFPKLLCDVFAPFNSGNYSISGNISASAKLRPEVRLKHEHDDQNRTFD